MVKSLRKKHLQIWTVWALLIPIVIISAVIVRPTLPKDRLLQPAATAALPVVLKSFEKDNYRISIRSNSDTSLVQLEWVNKKTQIYPTATIYEDTTGRKHLEGAALLGRIEARGTYHFAMSKNLVRSNYHFIVYDFVHQKIIETITF